MNGTATKQLFSSYKTLSGNAWKLLLPGLEQGVELQAYPRSPTELLTRT